MTTKAVQREIRHVHDLLSLRDLLADRGVPRKSCVATTPRSPAPADASPRWRRRALATSRPERPPWLSDDAPDHLLQHLPRSPRLFFAVEEMGIDAKGDLTRRVAELP